MWGGLNLEFLLASKRLQTGNTRCKRSQNVYLYWYYNSSWLSLIYLYWYNNNSWLSLFYLNWYYNYSWYLYLDW